MLKAVSNRAEDRSPSQNNVGRYKHRPETTRWNVDRVNMKAYILEYTNIFKAGFRKQWSLGKVVW